MTHAVRARLVDGWAEQPCPDAKAAAALFDRLRRFPHVELHLVAGGRVVEVRQPGVDARPG